MEKSLGSVWSEMCRTPLRRTEATLGETCPPISVKPELVVALQARARLRSVVTWPYVLPAYPKRCPTGIFLLYRSPFKPCSLPATVAGTSATAVKKRSQGLSWANRDDSD